MMRSLATIVAILNLAVAVNTAAALDIVNRKSTTKPAQGSITQVSRESITVKAALGKPVTIPANDILSIHWNGEPPKLNLARSDEAGGRLQKALDTYVEVLTQIASGHEHLKQDVEYLIARTTANMALASSTNLDTATKKLEDFRISGADSFRYFEAMGLLGQLYMVQNEFERAQSAYEEFSKAPWKENQMAAKTAMARLLLIRGDPQKALAAFQSVLDEKAESPSEQARRYEAMLGKATCLIRQKKAQAALKELESVITQAPPEESNVQAEAYLRQGECLQEMGKTKEAVLAYLHVPVLFSKESAQNAEALYHLTRLWTAVDRPERAAEARTELETKYPDSQWTKKLSGAAGQ